MPSKNKKQWLKDTLGPAVEKYPERQQNFKTDSDIPIEPLYGSEDLADRLFFRVLILIVVLAAMLLVAALVFMRFLRQRPAHGSELK